MYKNRSEKLEKVYKDKVIIEKILTLMQKERKNNSEKSKRNK